MFDPHANHGAPSSDRTRFLRPLLSEPGHDAQRRPWKSDRAATADDPAQIGKQRVCRFRVSAVPRSIELLDGNAPHDSYRRGGTDRGDAEEWRSNRSGISLTDDEDAQDPWTLPPSRKRLERHIAGSLPERVRVVRANLLYIEKKGLPSQMLNRLLRLAAFQNPEFYKAQAMRLSTFGKPRVIACGEDLVHHIALPRGCMAELKTLLQAHRIKPEIRDGRCAGTRINVEFCGQLRSRQQEAVSKVIEHDEGILCAP